MHPWLIPYGASHQNKAVVLKLYTAWAHFQFVTKLRRIY